jgi:hypothetical protein
MSDKQKLLIFMPTYEVDGIVQAWPAAVDSFYNLEVPDSYEADWVIGLDNPYGIEGKHKNTLHQYQQIRRRVLDEGYDALVTFEHDMIVPQGGLIKLLATDAPIVYGLYMLRHGAYCVNAFNYIKDSPNLQKSMTYLPREYRKAMTRGWARVTGVGMGFTLFRRNVLEMFDFRPSGNSYPPDWAIAVDSTKYGLKQICRFDVKCGHIEKNGLPVYPTQEGFETMTRVKILKQFVYQQLYEPGMIVNVPTEKVDDFFRAGYIEILGEPDAPAVKIVRKPDKRSTKAIKDKMDDKVIAEKEVGKAVK